jgi:hypothetical protein
MVWALRNDDLVKRGTCAKGCRGVILASPRLSESLIRCVSALIVELQTLRCQTLIRRLNSVNGRASARSGRTTGPPMRCDLPFEKLLQRPQEPSRSESDTVPLYFCIRSLKRLGRVMPDALLGSGVKPGCDLISESLMEESRLRERTPSLSPATPASRGCGC